MVAVSTGGQPDHFRVVYLPRIADLEKADKETGRISDGYHQEIMKKVMEYTKKREDGTFMEFCLLSFCISIISPVDQS